MSIEKTEHYPPDEWIPTNGKKPELPDDTLLDVKFTNGTVDIRSRADLWIWTQNGYSHDITHYRIHQPASTVQGEPVGYVMPHQLEALESLIKGYVSLLEGGIDRITSLDGYCYSIPDMLRAALAALATHHKGGDQL